MMRNKFTALAVLAAALSLWATTPASAQRWGGHGHFGGYRGFGGYGGWHGGWHGGYHGAWGYGRAFYPRYAFGYGYGGLGRWGGYYRPYYGGYGYGGWLYGAPYYGGYASGYGGYPYYDYGSYYPYTTGNTVYLDTTVAAAPPTNDRVSMYYAPTADNKARLDVKLPAGAKLWVAGVETRQTGAAREFESPQLTPGKTYSYELKARWEENGQPVERTRTVQVRANETTMVNFDDGK